jgi:hypothetical protein
VSGCLQFGRGELGWGRRRRNRGGESQQSLNILAVTDGIIDGHVLSVYLSVILTVNGPRHCNPSVITSVKSSEKFHVIKLFLFFKILYIPSAIQSVYTDRIIPSVYTDRIAYRIYKVSNYYRQQRFVGIDRQN